MEGITPKPFINTNFRFVIHKLKTNNTQTNSINEIKKRKRSQSPIREKEEVLVFQPISKV